LSAETGSPRDESVRLADWKPIFHGTSPAQKCHVLAFVFLVIGLLCAIISRILLVIAALDVSAWWTLGVLLPFGPLLFRLNYPDLAHSSRLLRLAAIPCFFFYLVLGPGLSYKHHLSKATQAGSAQPAHYGLETHKPHGKPSKSSGPVVELTPNIEDRRTANFREFQRLYAWNEALKLRKRDLLHSDAEGNRAYDLELAQYNAALQKANAEKNAIAASPK
jgi:hypothetical protein